MTRQIFPKSCILTKKLIKVMHSGEKRQKIWFSYNFFVPLQGIM